MSMQVGGANPLQVGARVTVGKKPGTVRFIGATKFAAGEWFGVELDDSSGKNDGSHDGVTYFTCPADCGVFVRKLQVKPLVDPSAASVSSASSRRSSLSGSTTSTTSSRRASLSASSSTSSVAARRSSVSGTSSGLAASRRSSLTGTKAALSKPKTSAAPAAAAASPDDEPSGLDTSVLDASLADVLSAAELSMAGEHIRDGDVPTNSALDASVTAGAIAEEGDGDGDSNEVGSKNTNSSTNTLSSPPTPAAPSTPGTSMQPSSSSAPGSGGSSDGGSGQKKKAAPWMVKKSPPRSSKSKSPPRSGLAAASAAARSSPSLPLAASSPASSSGGSPGAFSRASLGGSSPPPVGSSLSADGHTATTNSDDAEATKAENGRLRDQLTKLTKALSASEAKVERESAGRAAAQQAAAAAQSAAEAAHATATKAKATAAAAQAEAKEALAEAARADEHGGQRAWAAYDAEIAGLQGQLAQQARDLATVRQERDHARLDAEKARERAEAASKLQASAEAAMAIAREEAQEAQKALAAQISSANTRRRSQDGHGDAEDDFDGYDNGGSSSAAGGGAGRGRSTRSGRNSSSGGGGSSTDSVAEVQAQLAVALESQAAEAKAAKEWMRKCAKIEEAMSSALAAQEQAELNKEEVELRVEELELEVETLKEQAEFEQQLRQSGLRRRAGTSADASSAALENDNEAATAQGGDGEEEEAAAAEIAALAAERDSLADLLRQVHASAAATEKRLNEDLATASAAAAANADAAERAEKAELALAEAEERAKELEARLEEGAGDEAAAEELAEALAEAKAALQAAKEDAESRREALVMSEENVELLEETEELLRDELKHAKQAAEDAESESASLRASLTGQAQEVAQVRRDLSRASAELAEVRRRRDEATAELQQLTNQQGTSRGNKSSSSTRNSGRSWKSSSELGGGGGGEEERDAHMLARAAQDRKLREAEVRCARLQALLPPDLLQQAALDFNRRYGASDGGGGGGGSSSSGAASKEGADKGGKEGKGSAVVVSEEEMLDGEVTLARCVSKVASLRNSLGRRASASLAHALATRQDLAAAQADLARAKRAALASAALEARRSGSNKNAQGSSKGGIGLDAKKLKALKVSDLRAELDRRSLSTAGLKADLLARLSDALEEEDRAAREEEEEKAKGATEAGGGDDEFEDCLPDDGDAEDQTTSGSVGSSKSTSNLSVGTAEANLVAAQAAASAAAQAAATWVSKRGSTSSGLRLTAGASPSSSSVVGHEFPWLLRGGFACRALLHLATSEADGEEGLTSGSGASSAAVAGTLAAEARATVHRFEACVDALSTASTEVNSSSGSSNSNGGAASEEATHEVSHLLAPSNLPSACSSDRLEGAVLALERFLSVNWPNVMSSSSSSAAVASAHAAATGVPALQGLLQLHLLLDHALAAALTAAAAAAGSTAGGTAKDSSGSSGLSTSTLSNACSFLEDCASMVRAIEGRTAPASPEFGDWDSSNGDDDVDDDTQANGAPSAWSLSPLSPSMTATVATLFEGVTSLARMMEDGDAATATGSDGAHDDDNSSSSPNSSAISTVLSDLQSKALDAARAATTARASSNDGSSGTRLLDERMAWRAVAAYGKLPAMGTATSRSSRPETNNSTTASAAGGASAGGSGAAAASSGSSGASTLESVSGPPAVVRARACRAFVSSAVACGPELRLTKQALDNAVGAKAAHERELKAALAQRDKASKQLAEAQAHLQNQLKVAEEAAAAAQQKDNDANGNDSRNSNENSVARLSAEKAALENELSKLTDDFMALQRQQTAKPAQAPPPLPPPPGSKSGSQQLPPPPLPPPPRAVASAASATSVKSASSSGAATKDFFAALGEAKLPPSRRASSSAISMVTNATKDGTNFRSYGGASSSSSSGGVMGRASTGGDAGALLEANALEAALQRARAEAAHWRQAARKRQQQSSGWLDLKPLPVLTGLGSSNSSSISNRSSSGDISSLPNDTDKTAMSKASSSEGQPVESDVPTRAAALASVKALEVATMERQALSPLIRLSPRGSSRADPLDLASSPSSSSSQDGSKAVSTRQQQQHYPSARAQMLGLQADMARLVAEHRATCHNASAALRSTEGGKHNSSRRGANAFGDFSTFARSPQQQEAAGLLKARLTFRDQSSVQGLNQSNARVAVSKHELLRITAALAAMA